jgi:hypothetical protein
MNVVTVPPPESVIPPAQRTLPASESALRPAARRRGRLLRLFGAVAVLMLVGLLASSAFGVNPAEAMAGGKPMTGGTDPHGDSWQSIQNSIAQFAHFNFILRLFLSLALAVACAWVIAWHPRRASLVDPLSDFEERKALIILGMVGAVVAELSSNNQTLAFVIFGIGALLRFRTALDNPKLTGKAITVVIVGLSCGLGSWAMAVFVTVFSWILVYWLDSHVSCRIKVKLDDESDLQAVFGNLQSYLVSSHCRLHSATLYEAKRQMAFVLQMPAGLDPKHLESDLRAKLPDPDEGQITIQVA